MATFTLPYELRGLAWFNQNMVYSILFSSVASTLKDFGLNSKILGGAIGMTMELHTSSRKLEYHPHIHAVIPGGAVKKDRRYWKKVKGKYLFPQKSLAKVFRARFLTAILEEGLSLQQNVPTSWVVDCAHVGQGKDKIQNLAWSGFSMVNPATCSSARVPACKRLWLSPWKCEKVTLACAAYSPGHIS